MEKCACEKHGYCEYFRQEMTYSPPNWQWCQSATEEERKKYKIDCDKKHERRRWYLTGEYITTSKMVEDCKNLLLPKVAQLKLRGVLGIPRSGLSPASLIAMWLNLPLYYLDDNNELNILSAGSEFGGNRMKNYLPNNDRILVVDDTVYGGCAIKNTMSRMSEDAYYSAVYVRPEMLDVVDFYGRELAEPHLLEWNFFNSGYLKDSIFDFDGIFSPNIPVDICEDEQKYIEFIKNVKPFPHRIPRTHCKGIATGRLEKYRDITEEWLDRYGISYGFLKMFPTERETERNRNHAEEVSTFKAKIFSESDAKFFVESEISEAIKIRQKSGKLVICPDER